MFGYSDNGITIAAILDNRRANKDGLFPVKIRVAYKRERKYYSTGKWPSLSEWERLPDAKSKSLSEVKKDIQLAADKIKQTVRDLIKEDAFTFGNLNIRLGNALGRTVNTVIKNKVDKLLTNNQFSTSAIYRSTEMHLSRFAGSNIKFNQVTPEWLRRFERYFLDNKISHTTISIYLNALKAIFNEAKGTGILKASQFPFGRSKYEIPQPAGRKIALSIQDISRVVNYECRTSRMEMVRDLWFFSYLCNGANIADIYRFKFSNIRNNEIAFYRRKTQNKTKKLILAFITPEMQSIMNKWGNPPGNQDEYIFPFLKGKETPIEEEKIKKGLISLMDNQLKLIAKALGITGLSTYTARHSYASVLKRSGANIAFISESLGHSNLKTTENYLASFEQEERVKNAALLTNF